MGKNVDGDKKRKIYMGDTLSLSNARGEVFFFFDVGKREGVPHVYFSLSTAVYIFTHCMFSPCSYALRSQT